MRKRKNNIYRVALVAAECLAACVFAVSCRGGDAGCTPAEKKYAYDKTYKRGPLELTVSVSDLDVTIADRIDLVIRARIKEDYNIEFPGFGEKLQQFGIKDYSNPPERLAGNGTVVRERSYVLEPFLSGDYVIPPMKFVFQKKDGDDKKHELLTEKIKVKVTSLLPEKQAELDIKDIAGPVELEAPSMTLLYAAIAGAVIIIAVVIVILGFRKKKEREAAALMLPAHEIAYAALEALLKKNLVEKGEVKLFYIYLTGILRHYIEHRFAVHAPERTTEEFLDEIKSSSVFPDAHREMLERFLRHADLVKFAALEPGEADIKQTFDSAREFIDATASRDNTVEVPEKAVVQAEGSGA